MYDPTSLSDAVDCEDSEAPKQADGTPLIVSRKGKVDLRVRVGHKYVMLALENVWLAFQLTQNRFSYGQLTKSGCEFVN